MNPGIEIFREKKSEAEKGLSGSNNILFFMLTAFGTVLVFGSIYISSKEPIVDEGEEISDSFFSQEFYDGFDAVGSEQDFGDTMQYGSSDRTIDAVIPRDATEAGYAGGGVSSSAYPPKSVQSQFQQSYDLSAGSRVFEKNILPENEISWTSGDGAKVYLKKATVFETESTTQYLQLSFDVRTTDGGYCWDVMGTYLRTMNEQGDYVAPDPVQHSCISGHAVLYAQSIQFMMASSQDHFDIFNRGRDKNGETVMVKLFSVIKDGTELLVIGYPQT